MEKTNRDTLIHTYNCRLCHDTGYVIRSAIVPEYDPKTPLEIGDPCPVCKGHCQDDATGIPAVFSEADMRHFDFGRYKAINPNFEKVTSSFWKQFERWEQRNKGLNLWSQTRGSGKTLLACCLSSSVQVKYRRRIKFISSPEYLSRVSEAYKREPWQQDGLYAYMNCDLLVLDDFGSEKRGEWQDQELFRLIDYRMNHGKLLIVTSNLPISELKCDTRISDRLNRLCIPLHFPEESIRAKTAEEENRNFIQSILQNG